MSEAKPPRKKSNSARHRSRAAAVQALYQWQLKQHSVEDVYAHCLEHHAEAKLDKDYFKILIFGVVEHVDTLDQLMSRALDRAIASLTPVELAVMRLALFELKYCLSVPAPVVINEALELAKEFGTDEGYRYINGVLDALLGKVRP
jgi:transcription antitermination protein NusB